MDPWEDAACWNCSTVNMQGRLWGLGEVEGSEVNDGLEDMVRDAEGE